MHSKDSQFKKHHKHKKHRHLVVGGVVIPTWPGYWVSVGGVGGYGGGDMSTATDTGGGQSSGAGDGSADGGGATGQ